jgi:adenine-specific DNA-methyltransferase
MTSAEAWPDSAARRRLGAYYTPSNAAQFMADWVARAAGETLLEPSFGDGVFLRAVGDTIASKDLPGVVVRGVELDPFVHRRAVESGLVSADCAQVGDFLSVSLPPVSGAIGNPPYVRLRHLPADQRARALAVAQRCLGRPMDPSGSVWMPFVLHACEALRPGGRFAFVLPFDLTYVRYARPLWAHLGERFGGLRVVRVRERIFTDILQDTVILFGEDKGFSTPEVHFETYETVQDLLERRASDTAQIALSEITKGNRPFIRALLSPELLGLLDGRILSSTREAREIVTFNIGYVAGDKTFFHPDNATAQRFKLPARSLLPAVTTTRRLNGHGLHTSDLRGEAVSQLFLPPPGELSRGEAAYVKQGETAGTHERYKCRIRQPWYRVPYVHVPDLVLSVFSSLPLLLVNDAGMVASNSLLCGYVSPGVSPDAIASAWYSSLTLLQTELEVHSLGGGVFVLVPNEAGRIRLPLVKRPRGQMLKHVANRLAEGDLAGAYGAGDDYVLIRSLGLTPDEVHLIRDGAARLARWRLAGQQAVTLPSAT